MNSRDNLSPVCRATLFDEEVRFSENIDFQQPMKAACTKEIDRFCKDVPHGNARVIRYVHHQVGVGLSADDGPGLLSACPSIL